MEATRYLNLEMMKALKQQRRELAAACAADGPDSCPLPRSSLQNSTDTPFRGS